MAPQVKNRIILMEQSFYCPLQLLTATSKLKVMWRLSRSRSKSRCLRKSNGIDIAILWSVTRFRYHIILEWPAIGAGGHRMGFTPPRVRSRWVQRIVGRL